MNKLTRWVLSWVFPKILAYYDYDYEVRENRALKQQVTAARQRVHDDLPRLLLLAVAGALGSSA